MRDTMQSNTSFGALITPWVFDKLEEGESHLLAVSLATPRVIWSDVSIDSVLGVGGFSSVFQVQVATSNNQDVPESKNRRKYAMKCLHAKRVDSEDKLVVAATDLFYEAHLLGRLDHQNIIRLQGVASEGLLRSYVEGEGYFLILDLLEETLVDRLKSWRRRAKSAKNIRSKLTRRCSAEHGGSSHLKKLTGRPSGRRFIRRRTIPSQDGQQEPARIPSLGERLKVVACGVVEGMKYLHSEGILLRDLKPENIGFDAAGTVKLFDLGLARPLEECSEGEIAGSFRYMAPENMICQPSGYPSDVYSFGVVLWELATLADPYDCFFGDKKALSLFKGKVVLEGWRHSVTEIPCKSTRQLIQDCWDPNPDVRPSFSRAWFSLEGICTPQDHTGFTSKRLKLKKAPQKV
jgi:serine/threonine protein kinase